MLAKVEVVLRQVSNEPAVTAFGDRIYIYRHGHGFNGFARKSVGRLLPRGGRQYRDEETQRSGKGGSHRTWEVRQMHTVMTRAVVRGLIHRVPSFHILRRAGRERTKRK